MTQTKTTKKALFSSVLSVLVCLAMLIGSTFAWFTDTATTGTNIIKSGNLDVAMYYADGTKNPATVTWADAEGKAIFNYDLWEPGYTVAKHIKISNDGNLALKYQVSFMLDGAVGDLAEVIDVYFIDPAKQVEKRSDISNLTSVGTLDKFLSGGAISGDLEAGKSNQMTVILKMQETANNDYQNKSVGENLTILVKAFQDTVESDSFGSDYDAGAEKVTTSVNDFDELVMAIENGEDVVLNAPVALSNTLEVAEDSEITIDLNGYSLTAATGVFAIENNGTLIIDDSVGSGTVSARIGVDNYGTLIMNGGSIVATEQGGAAVYNNAESGATFIMNDGVLKATYVGSYADSTGGACVRNQAGCKTVITKGTFNSRSARTYAIISDGILEITPEYEGAVTLTAYRGVAIDDGTAVINGGDFTVLDANETEGRYVAYENYYSLYIGGGESVTVNGGNFIAPDQSVWNPTWSETPLTINGGYFNTSMSGVDEYHANKMITIYGGTYAELPAAEYIAEGYTVSANSDNTYTVVSAN